MTSRNSSFRLGLAALAVLLSGCTRTVYEPVESVRTEYRDRVVERLVADTVADTRLIFIKGDTILDIREKERTHRVEIHDTLKVIVADTIRVPYPVERQLSRWEKAKMDFGGLALGALGVTLCFIIAWLAKRFRK